MRKIGFLLIPAALALAIAGCGDSKDQETPTPSTPSAATPAPGSSDAAKPSAPPSATPGNMVGSTGSDSTQGMVSEIQKKLDSDPAMAGAKVKASLAGSTIQLEGTVAKMDQKDKADDIVMGVQNARKAQVGDMNNLMVK